MSLPCSHCGGNGHSSRTCEDSKRGFKLFGVRLSTSDCCKTSSSPGASSECTPSSAMAMRKSVSMGNLSNYAGPEGGAYLLSPSRLKEHDLGMPVEGYASDDLVHTSSSSRDRKKGVPWTEEEHRSFLTGLQTLGKGDWRGISRNFVITRTPTQVASHAQKYYLRKNNLSKRRRRSSLFDITPDSVSRVLEEPVLEETACTDPDVSAELSLGQNIPNRPSHTFKASYLTGPCSLSGYSPVPSPHFSWACAPSRTSDSIRVPPKHWERQAVEVTESGTSCRSIDVDAMELVPELVDVIEGTSNVIQSNVSAGQALIWPGQYNYGLIKPELMESEFKIVRPIPMIPNAPQKAGETLTMSELTFDMARRVMEPTPLSFKLLNEGTRHSAFHVTAPNSGSRDVDGQGSLSSAISVP